MPYRLAIRDSKHDSLTLGDLTIPREGLTVAALSKKQQNVLSPFVAIEEITEEQVAAAQAAALKTIGYVYHGPAAMRVDGISGEFAPGVPRFDLSDEELSLAATTGCVLERVENHS